MGDWDRETDWDRDALLRIIVLLFSLAGLADRAAEVSFFRRRQALGILSRGEAEARAFVIGMVCGAPAPADAPESIGDAACLAIRLRALALLLWAMLGRWFAPSGTAGPRACRPSRKIFGPVCGRTPPPVPDTS